MSTHQTNENVIVFHDEPKDADNKASQQIRNFPKMDTAALHGLPGDIVNTLKPCTESDPSGLLLTLHAFFGNAIGRGPYYQVEGDRHGPNIFVLLVGDTSKARKGTGAGRIKQIFHDADEAWLTSRVHTGLSSGEGVIWEVRNPVVRVAKGEEEETDAGVSDKRLMILESEFAGPLKAMERDGNILSRVLRDAWDSGSLGTLTKSSPARATGACISIVGHITASELRRYLTKTELGNGFANRFLFGCVRRSQRLPFRGVLDEQCIAELGAKIRTKILRARSIDRVTMDTQARQCWRKIYEDLSEGRPGLLGALTARAEAQVVRLALLYALWDDPPGAEGPTALIGLRHLEAALAVWKFCDQSARYLFGEALGDPVADTILHALKLAGVKGLTRTEMCNLFSRNVPAGEIARALDELSRLGLAEPNKSSKDRGRPPETWNYVSRCNEQNESNEEALPGTRVNSFNSFNSYPVDDGLLPEPPRSGDNEKNELNEKSNASVFGPIGPASVARARQRFDAMAVRFDALRSRIP